MIASFSLTPVADRHIKFFMSRLMNVKYVFLAQQMHIADWNVTLAITAFWFTKYSNKLGFLLFVHLTSVE